MVRRGEVYENPVTGERVVIRLGTQETGGERLIADIYARPGAAVPGEHVHPSVDETFTILKGRVGFSIDGRKSIAEAGQTLHVPRGVVHGWWNAGDGEAHIVVEVTPGARFVKMVLNLFGLAQDGRTDKKGMPDLLQLALLTREFGDVIRFTWPPRPVQRALFGFLAPVARLRGYRGSYPKYETRPPMHVLSEESPGLMPLAS
ncbi:MAG TPA: cupin domain-containing protein [Thermoanaerobaculia bacterium]|nr:cupin domain-containing protein [Thermoanaerobaculia bacterium]